MALHYRKPAPPLDQFVQGVYIFEGAPQPHSRERALPDGCLQILFNLREDRTRVYDRYRSDACHTFNGSLIVGPQTEFCVIDPAELLSVAGVHFKPGGAAAFLPAPIQKFQGNHVPLDTLWRGFALELRERLLEAQSMSERLDLLEQALLICALRFGGRGPLLKPHPAVRFALDVFSQPARGPAPVAQVVEKTGFSQRHFIDLFQREVGMTPKLFCRVQRFQQVLQQIATADEVDWAKIAVDAGYFDQAHFIHDFRAFSGINPSTYRSTPRLFPNHVPIT